MGDFVRVTQFTLGKLLEGTEMKMALGEVHCILRRIKYVLACVHIA